MKLGRRLHETESQWSSYDTGWMDGVHFKHFAQIYFAFPRQLIVVLRIDSLAQQRQYRDVAKKTGPPLLSGRVSSFVVQTIRIVTEKDVLKKLTTMEAMTMDARDWQTEGRRSSHFRLPH